MSDFAVIRDQYGDAQAIAENGVWVIHLNPGSMRTEENIDRIVSMLNQSEPTNSRRFGDCDCGEDVEQLPSDEYECEECGKSVWVCKECYTIIAGCGCGHCSDGMQFKESDY